MFTFTDWLALHGLSAPGVKGVISAFFAGKFECLPPFLSPDRKASVGNDSISNKLSSQESCYKNIVVPALARAFDNESEVQHLLCNYVELRSLNNCKEAPYTLCKGRGKPPAVFMDWYGRVEDLVCLVHETAHALQILLSKHELMPPVARETCAFVGELLLLDYVKAHLPNFYAVFLDVWHSENSFYLDSCVDALMDALNHSKIPYHYYQNYFLARLAAVQIFYVTPEESLSALFSSGKDAMAHLPIDEMASFSIEMKNPLPALPTPDAAQRSVDAYQSLGVMTLLDIESYRDTSCKRIDSYYLNLLKNLHESTAFIALDNENKPVGYATWVRSVVDNNMVLTCQTALSNNRFNLQCALQRHISINEGVKVSYTRNAFKEMLVW
ncbi:MAG: hypothetical protein JJT87_01895 [Halomonas sp.]|nr:hypothetical protein [Halomonas sp.]MCC5900666.1 hypothetical protein [Halomonas sp.]